MAVIIGSARIDERGKAYGGQAGDQKGNECSTQSWYKHSKGWRVIRAKDPEHRKKLAACMKAACANQHIGYDQYQRNTLYTEAAKYGFDVSKVTKNVETDCSALVRVCVAYACGITNLPSEFRTVNMCGYLLKTGAFVEMSGSKYTDQSTYLCAGDILCTKTSGHTVIVLTDGSKAEKTVYTPVTYDYATRNLEHGCTGADVKQLQTYLIQLGFSCGSWGADGDFGDATEQAVMAFQRKYSLEVDGIVGKNTFSKIDEVLDAEHTGGTLRVVGGNCWIRSAPVDGAKFSVAHEGAVLSYSEKRDGWYFVKQGAIEGWISGKYASEV